MEKSFTIPISRRDLFKLAGLAAFAVKNKIDANKLDWAIVPNRSYVSAR